MTPAPASGPAWRDPHDLENLAPAGLALALAAAFQGLLPDALVLIHPGWLLPALELALVTVLVVVDFGPWTINLRPVSIVLVALILTDNTVSSVLLVLNLVHVLPNAATLSAAHLLAAGGSIYVTNVIAYGVWYWQLDRGGPHARAEARYPHPDFLFPQMATPELHQPDWRPLFLDYLYVSLTNATAFSPTDTLPLTRRAKALMALQSLVALATLALVLARAVNILQ
jgi:hypothetical protein